MNMADAAITLRSLPRRFGEVLAGPKGDDAWERLVRKPAANGQSPLGWAARTSSLLDALGSAVAALPIQSRPVVASEVTDTEISEARLGTPATVLADLKTAANRAADAIDARQHDDFERLITLEGRERSAHDVVEHIVLSSVANIKNAQVALYQVSDGRNPSVDEDT
jgi:hypothetical protein